MDNPYVQARREWDDRYGDLVLARRNWQILSRSFASTSSARDITSAANSRAAAQLRECGKIRRHNLDLDRSRRGSAG